MFLRLVSPREDVSWGSDPCILVWKVRFGAGEEAIWRDFLLPSILLSSVFPCLPLPPPLRLPLSPPQKLESPSTWLRRPGALLPLPRVLSIVPLTLPGRSCRPSTGASPHTPQGTREPGARMLLRNGARKTVV